MLPWVHMNVATNGDVKPCCVADQNRPVGNLHSAALKELWNSADMRRMRLNMLGGEKSPQCRYCYDLEKGQFPSPRQYANKHFAHHFPAVEKTRPDGSLERPRMALMDIRFSNVCNFRCRTCTPTASSSWHEDAKALNGYSDPKILTPTADPEDLWRQIEPLIPDLEEIWFTGGEPFLGNDHLRLLNLLIHKRILNVKIRYSTNFSAITRWSADVMKAWSHFRGIEIRASLDAIGKRGDYLRKGMAWKQVIRDRKAMATICPEVHFMVAPTISIMNVLHLPDFHREWLEQGLVKFGNWRPNILSSPEEYCIQALPSSIKQEVIEKYERHIETTLRPRKGDDEPLTEKAPDATPEQRAEAPPKPTDMAKGDTFYKIAMSLNAGWRSRMPDKTPGASADAMYYKATLNFMTARDRSAWLPKFRETTGNLDRLRGENFSEVFPELARLMD